ncbi:PASTA domain-containing protein [Nonomuraea guangzhouensis]|uniref:PASTA domain-containing protein n=1 Tax=Nonomuraea guangzhouensis TaxID=1291555 RepID=A0ABW4G4W8_9ACTN|nr:PASTA domain-containing protein [Nonomuraea guangzhouensis]
MKVEDALADAMATHVADVQATPSLGRDVRRRHRAHVIRFRTAGAALATALVAVAVPVMLNPAEPAKTQHTATTPTTGPDRAVVDSVIVPEVRDMPAAKAIETLKQAGLVVEDPETATAKGLVQTQEPAAGQEVAKGTNVQLTVARASSMPQDLGDLGDGRKFGGIHLGYLPDGLEWGKWSGKNGFGKTSYTTTFKEPGQEEGFYAVQVVVFADEASKEITERLARYPDEGAETLDVSGKRAYLTKVTEGGEVAAKGDDVSTSTIGWTLRKGLAVEVYISPDYSKKVDAQVELKKIAEGIEPVE